MKTLAFFLLIIGIVFIVMGYMDIFLKSKYAKKEIEYRFIPRSVYDQIETEVDISDKYADLFNKKDVLFRQGSIYPSNLI